jgi:hypothetical protein
MHQLRTTVTALAVLAALAGSAGATIITSHLSSDAQLLALLSDTLFVAEGRIGDGSGAATFEIDLGASTGAPDATAQYDWPNGTAVPWTLTYDGTTNLVTFTVNGVPLQYTPPLSGFTEIFVRTRATNAGTDIVVNDLTVDSEAVGDVSQAFGADGLDILWIHGGSVGDGFTMNGQTTMSWTGARPSQSRLAFQIKVGWSFTVYTGDVTWGRLKQMFNN